MRVTVTRLTFSKLATSSVANIVMALAGAVDGDGFSNRFGAARGLRLPFVLVLMNGVEHFGF